MLSTTQSLLIIAVAAVCTFATRLFPFLLFGGRKRVPAAITYLGKVLPPAIMATLIIYCLKSVNFAQFPSGTAEVVSILLVAALHAWKRNTLLSMAAGTVCYMALIRIF